MCARASCAAAACACACRSSRSRSSGSCSSSRAMSSRGRSCVSVCGPKGPSSISSTASTRRSSGCAPRSATMPTSRRSSRPCRAAGIGSSGACRVEAATARQPPPRHRACGWWCCPFSNLSDDSSQEYFSDGLTEELIAQLGPLCRGQVGIIARWSSMFFKGSLQRAREIGEALEAPSICSKAARGATARACASPRGSSRRRPRRTCGPRPTSAAPRTGCRCRPTSPAASPGR